MDDRLINDEEDLACSSPEETEKSKEEESLSHHGNHNQPSTSYSSETGRHSPVTSAQELIIQESPQSDKRPARTLSWAKQGRCKAWPRRTQFKLSEKRTLSGSSENLPNEDRPRKSFCRGLLKRWFFPSDKSDRDRSRSTSYEEDQKAFTNVISQVGNQGTVGPQVTDRRTSDLQQETLTGGVGSGLSRSCMDMLTEIKCTLNEGPSHGDGLLPCKSAKAISSESGQAERTWVPDLGHCEARQEDTRVDSLDDFPVPALHLNQLPPQLLAHVFSFLTVRELLCTAALVCKHWECVTHFWTLWHQMRFREHTNVTDQDLIKLCSRHCGVGFLDLSDCLRITDDGLEKAFVHCNMLRDVFLIRCSQLTDRAFLSLANHCSNLTCIDLSGCSGLTDQALQSIAKGCPWLRKVRLKQCPLISDASLQVVARSCPRLKVLTLMDNDKITDTALEALATYSHNLEILCLQNCGIGPPGLAQVAKMHLLKKLDLSNLPTLTADSVQGVARHCPLLDTLNLSLSRDVRDDCVLSVARLCKRLTTLFLISCAITDHALHGIGDNSSLLEHLDVSWCSHITDRGAAYVSDRCPRLKYLGLIRCTKVSDAAVERMVEDHPAVHYSTFLLDSQRLIDKAKEQGFVTSE
ncbi:F-box/LRR-repeat protein 17-like [Acanthaster planci]|uniref:F-box/LRR-repeat protein 17-like n=1 Tax=Acanthaster planci TaxID=133434 RepID=A0A8B7Z4G4_ACAPL|nr:F-box/LRR-repeat protein 17-like [Acanthaster planci]